VSLKSFSDCILDHPAFRSSGTALKSRGLVGFTKRLYKLFEVICESGGPRRAFSETYTLFANGRLVKSKDQIHRCRLLIPAEFIYTNVVIVVPATLSIICKPLTTLD
jgi:hypothetical protein